MCLQYYIHTAQVQFSSSTIIITNENKVMLIIRRKCILIYLRFYIGKLNRA